MHKKISYTVDWWKDWRKPEAPYEFLRISEKTNTVSFFVACWTWASPMQRILRFGSESHMIKEVTEATKLINEDWLWELTRIAKFFGQLHYQILHSSGLHSKLISQDYLPKWWKLGRWSCLSKLLLGGESQHYPAAMRTDIGWFIWYLVWTLTIILLLLFPPPPLFLSEILLIFAICF